MHHDWYMVVGFFLGYPLLVDPTECINRPTNGGLYRARADKPYALLLANLQLGSPMEWGWIWH